MSADGQPAWLQDINRQLDEQYRAHEASFEVLVNAYAESLQREEAAVDAQDILEEQLQRLQTTLAALRDELGALKAGGGHAMDSRKYQELEAKYRQAKQERMELLRTQSQNSQKLLDLSEQAKGREAATERLEREVKRLQSSAGNVDTRIAYYMQLVEEKNLNIQDELQALQLELLQTDERVKSLERENQQLVQRWLSKVTETVDRLNAEVELNASPSSPPQLASPQCRMLARTDLDRPVAGLVTSPNSDLILPLADPDLHRGMLVLRGLDKPESVPLSSSSSLPSPSASPSAIFLSAPRPDRLVTATFSRDADMCIGAGQGDPECASIWNIESGRLLDSLAGGPGNPFVDVTPLSLTNTAIVSLHSPNLLRLYDLPRAFCLWTEALEAPAARIVPLQLHNADMVAVLLDDSRVQLWDIRQRRVARKSVLQIGRLSALSSDVQHGNLLACNERTVVVLDPGSLRVIRTVQHPAMSFAANAAHPYLAISPGGGRKFVASTKSSLIYGDYHDGTVGAVLSHHEHDIAGVGWITARDGLQHHLVSVDSGGTIAILDPTLAV